MMFSLASLVTLLSLSSLSLADDLCETYNRYEEKIHCGPDGYLLHFGLRNCKNFNSNETREMFTEVGQKFIDCTTSCLVSKLNDMFMNKTPTCSSVTTDAFESHVDCYLKCGFCDVCKTEKAALFHTYYIRDFFSFAAIRQVASVLANCGLFSCVW